MATIKATFSEVKKNMPRHVWWIILFSALLVVVILLVLLIGGKKDKNIKAPEIALEIATEPSEIEWIDSKIGEKQTQSIKITTNTAAKIPSIKLSENIDGLSINTICTNMGEITPEIPCTAELSWTPKTDLAKTGVKILIEYYPASAEAKMAQTIELPVALSTFVPPPPQPEPKPVKEEPVQNPITTAVETLAPTIEEPKITQPTTSALDTERCYEFAFGGYDTYGKQIGWIRPQAGRYLFHPFSDVNCTQPTGEYNPDTGFITDLKNPSKKIGSDLDRIGFIASGAKIPVLSNPAPERTVNKARQKTGTGPDLPGAAGGSQRLSEINPAFAYKPTSNLVPSSAGQAFVSTDPYDRSFVLRQYKPIPATIVNEVRADAKIERQSMLPVQATVDRHVYSDNGRTIIIPTGTLMLGYLTGEMPGPYKAIGRMQIKWYRFVRPDGVEFSFADNEPFAGDSQGRVGVPGHGSTDYMEQFIMPMITAIVPAAVNLIAPISDKFVNQIDLDNHTVTQSGQVRSSELAKNEIITTWNRVAQKLMVDMLDNTVPPFSIAAGTRITVYSPKDLIVNFCDKVDGIANCSDLIKPSGYISHVSKSIGTAPTPDGPWVNYNDPSWVGQVRGFDIQKFCGQNGQLASGVTAQTISDAGYDYRTVVAYCQATQYQAINNAKQAAVYANQQQAGIVGADGKQVTKGTKEYNQQVLGLEYNPDGTIKNPFVKEQAPAAQPPVAVLTCEDGNPPDENGCCAGETYTDMGEQGFNCCPVAGGDCFPPIK